MEEENIQYIEKFKKLFSFYNALYGYYYQLINLHCANKRNSNQIDVLTFYIKNISELAEEYIEKNITIRDAIDINEYILSKEQRNDNNNNNEPLIFDKISNSMNNHLSKNYSYNLSAITNEWTQKFISDPSLDKEIKIEGLSREEIGLQVYNKNKNEIINEAIEKTKENIVLLEIANDSCLSYLMELQKRIKNEKNKEIRIQLICNFYEVVFLNDDVQKIFILNNFKVYNFVRASELYEGHIPLKIDRLFEDAKDEIESIFDIPNDEYDLIDTIEEYIFSVTYLKSFLSLMNSVDISILKLYLLNEIKDAKANGKYEYYYKSINRVKRCFELMEQRKRKEEKQQDEKENKLEYIEKLNMLIKLNGELSDLYADLLNSRIFYNSEKHSNIVPLINEKLNEIDSYAANNIDIEDLNNIVEYITKNELSFLATDDSISTEPIFSVVIDRILNVAEQITSLYYTNYIIKYMKNRGLKPENLTDLERESISKLAQDFINESITSYRTDYEVNIRFLSCLSAIIDNTADRNVKRYLLDYYYKIIFINPQIEKDMLENNIQIMENPQINSINISEEMLISKIEDVFDKIITDNNAESNYFIAYDTINFLYLSVCLELLDIDTIERVENKFVSKISEIFSGELKDSIAENIEIAKDIFEKVKSNKRKVKK